MFIIKNYQQALLGHAYFLSSSDGRPLVYGSDEDVLINAGADYKEKIVLAATKFRQLTGHLAYTDAFDNEDYCGEACQRDDLIFIDRGDKGLTGIYSGSEVLEINAFTPRNLNAESCYVELHERSQNEHRRRR